MSYRYPFTPFPKGWYRVLLDGNVAQAFGRRLYLTDSNDDNLVFRDSKDPERLFPAIRKNGHFYTFYDDNMSSAYYEVPDIPEFSDSLHWQKPIRLSWKARVHTQEIVENALDMAHFCTVHTYKDIPHISRFNMIGHQFNVVMHSRKNIFGFIADTTMDITYHGMGIVVANVFSSTGITLKVLLTSTPFDDEKVDIRMDVAIKKTKSPIYNLLLRWMLPPHIKKEFTYDIPVWEAKMYRSRPILCHVEGNIVRIRKWATQFYT